MTLKKQEKYTLQKTTSGEWVGKYQKKYTHSKLESYTSKTTWNEASFPFPWDFMVSPQQSWRGLEFLITGSLAMFTKQQGALRVESGCLKSCFNLPRNYNLIIWSLARITLQACLLQHPPFPRVHNFELKGWYPIQKFPRMFHGLGELCIKQNSLKRRQEVPLMSAGVFHHITDY